MGYFETSDDYTFKWYLAYDGGEQPSLLLLPPRFDPPTKIAKLADAADCQTGREKKVCEIHNLQIQKFVFQTHLGSKMTNGFNLIALTHGVCQETGEP